MPPSQRGLSVTALHNHFFYDQPKVSFMHSGGEGAPVTLATDVKAVWDAIEAVRAAHPHRADGFGGVVPEPGKPDADALAKIVGHSAAVNDGVAKFTIGRTGNMHVNPTGTSMGLTTWASFSGSDAPAAMDGDLIMTAEEMQPVLHALRKAGIHIVALHTWSADNRCSISSISGAKATRSRWLAASM